MGLRVTVVGAGLMGAQIGAEYALYGHRVTLVSRSAASAETALRRAADGLAVLVRAAAIDQRQLADARDRIATSTRIVEACRGADLVIESVVEDLDAKADVLRQAVRAAEGATFASNTSSLSIRAIGDASGTADRLVGTHYLNPPLLLTPVEVVATDRTAPDLVERMVSLLRAMGKDPVVVKDIPGFVWNRLQFALMREAVALVAEGAADVRVIDLVIRQGLARRWSIVGPFETMRLGGRDTFEVIARQVFPSLATDVDPSLLRTIDLPADAGGSTARRDDQLGQWLAADRASR